MSATRPQARPWPLALDQSFDTTDDDIWSQAAEVMPEADGGPAGGHQQRQSVEALGAIVGHPTLRRARTPDIGRDLATVPGRI